MMKHKIFVGSVIVLFLAAAVIWVAGIRIFVVQPIGAIPKGVTVVVMGINGLNLIDSPDAFCTRAGTPNLICRGAVAARVANVGTILARLPFNQALYDLTGAPEYER